MFHGHTVINHYQLKIVIYYGFGKAFDRKAFYLSNFHWFYIAVWHRFNSRKLISRKNNRLKMPLRCYIELVFMTKLCMNFHRFKHRIRHLNRKNALWFLPFHIDDFEYWSENVCNSSCLNGNNRFATRQINMIHKPCISHRRSFRRIFRRFFLLIWHLWRAFRFLATRWDAIFGNK